MGAIKKAEDLVLEKYTLDDLRHDLNEKLERDFQNNQRDFSGFTDKMLLYFKHNNADFMKIIVELESLGYFLKYEDQIVKITFIEKHGFPLSIARVINRNESGVINHLLDEKNWFTEVIKYLVDNKQEIRTLQSTYGTGHSGLSIHGKVSVNFTTRTLTIEGGDLKVNLTSSQVHEIQAIYNDRKVLSLDHELMIRKHNLRHKTAIKVDAYLAEFFENLNKESQNK